MPIPIEKGEELLGFRRVVTQDRIAAYADASGDHNPIHLDEEFAATTRFGGTIAHGMLSLAFVWEMIAVNFPTSWHDGGTVKTRFTSPVIPGEEVRVHGIVKRTRMVADCKFVECEVAVTRPDGQNALSGTASIPVP